MKKINYYLGALALAAMGMTSCSDDLSPDSSKVSEVDKTLYVNMTIHGDNLSGSRAAENDGNPVAGTDFTDGDASKNESAVNNAYFVFYDEDGLVVGDLVPVTLGTAVNGDAGTVEKVYKSVVPVSVRKGEKNPVGVICYLNPISPSSLQTTFDQIQTVARERVTTSINGQTYFGMSNSVYYPAEGKSKPQIMVPINDGQLFKTEQEAKDAADTDLVVDIYVERYASKLTFNAVADGANTPYATKTRTFTTEAAEPIDVDVVLTFTPQYWALNAECTSSYVIKSFRRETTEGQLLADNYPWDVLNYRINVADPLSVDFDKTTIATSDILGTADRWAWNSATNHRSYWGMSPAYFQGEYPEVASDLETMTINNQRYISYADLSKTQNPLGWSATDATKKTQYFKETTVGNKALSGGNPAAAVPSVIYVGQYSMTVGGTPVTGNPNFYTYLKGSVTVDGKTEQRPFIYFDNDANGNSVVTGGESMLRRFCAQSTILFIKDENGEYIELGLDHFDIFSAALEVAEISKEVKAAVDGTSESTLKLQANARSLQFKSASAANPSTGSPIYISSGNGYKSIVADEATPGDDEITISQANAILMQQVGYAYYYSAGKGYFNIPVRHFGWYRPGNTNAAEGASMNWNLVRVGDFGMVRNHAYEITVNTITGLAAGIGGDNIPIVPPASTQDYYVAYKVNILKWAVVPTQRVDL